MYTENFCFVSIVVTLLLFSLAINKRDFRGHYGLGQAYEILKMPLMAMYFYKNAHTLRYYNTI